jgi:pimeloyl-ACP methyl ester carboxylesterase
MGRSRTFAGTGAHCIAGWVRSIANYILALQEAEFKYRYIIPSRAGYLRTPLSVAETPQEQAHAFAALLTALGIDRVATTASSGGGPSALQFAMQYPDRCSALILEECIIQKVRAERFVCARPEGVG